MPSSLRPLESAPIGDDLRIRLEGSIELLEDALPLLDSLTALLGRNESSTDDVQTLRECLTQLPRIAEALDTAQRHEEATALTRAVTARVHAAHQEANAKLENLGRPAAPSLRASVAAVLELLKVQGQPPSSGERPLVESKGTPWFLALALALVVSGLSYVLGAQAWAVLGLAAYIGTLVLAPSRPWALLPDRLYLPAGRSTLARAIAPGSIKDLEAQWGHVSMTVDGEPLTLRASSPDELITSLKLLQAPLLSDLESPARSFVVLDAVDEATRESGRALISAEGALFVATARKALLVKALTSEPLPVEPSLDQVLQLIAHLPEGRWAALGEHLEQRADARWLPRGGIAIDDDLNRLGTTLRHDSRIVRVVFSRDEKRVEAEALLGRLMR